MNTVPIVNILAWLGATLAGLGALYAFWIYIWKPYQKKHRTLIASQCGHETTIKGALDFDLPSNSQYYHLEGELPTNEEGIPSYCHECMSNMVIPCAWCGEPIIPGEPITLYSPAKEDYVPPKGARVYLPNMEEGEEDGWHALKKDGMLPKSPRLVGCMRWDCAETGADRAGFWNVPGQVVRVPSPLEMLMAGEDAVFINDMSDQKEAAKMAERHAELTSSNS